MARHIIKDHERGHRPPLSSTEKTEQYSIKITRSLKKELVTLGPAKVREILAEAVKVLKDVRWVDSLKNSDPVGIRFKR